MVEPVAVVEPAPAAEPGAAHVSTAEEPASAAEEPSQASRQVAYAIPAAAFGGQQGQQTHYGQAFENPVYGQSMGQQAFGNGAGGAGQQYYAYQQSPSQSGRIGSGGYSQTGGSYPGGYSNGYSNGYAGGHANPYAGHYGQQDAQVHTKDHVAAGLLAIFLGPLGLHKFYLGYMPEGFIMLAISILGGLLTLGMVTLATMVVSIIEGVLYLSKSQAEFERIYVRGMRAWF